MDLTTSVVMRRSIDRARAALVAGTIAITLNMVALASADLIPLATAHGGLLRLIVMLSGGRLHPPAGALFQSAFHFVVGLGMALAYAFLVDPIFNCPSGLKGLGYAIVVWLLNAAIVLPVIGEGFAGSHYLSLAGMAWFAGAHTLFFVLTALLYQRLQAA